jgi:hypothetical protein
MTKIQMTIAAAALCLAAPSSHAQVMSKKSTGNPATNGYATTEAAPRAGDTRATSSKHADKTKGMTNNMSAGASPAETAGASSPAGSPAMKKDLTRQTH